jgi:hypothetical protein
MSSSPEVLDPSFTARETRCIAGVDCGRQTFQKRPDASFTRTQRLFGSLTLDDLGREAGVKIGGESQFEFKWPMRLLKIDRENS